MGLFDIGRGKKGEGGSKGRKTSREEKARLEQARQEADRAEKREMEMKLKALEEKQRMHEMSVKEAEEKRKLEEDETKTELERRRGLIMDKTEQGSEKFDINMGTMGLVDRLEAHPAGKLLKNVVISNEPPPDREINVLRLRKFKPQNDFSKLSLGDIPPIKLTSEFMEMPITDAMTKDQYESLKDYVLVSDVFIHYIPLDSFFSVSAPVNFQLNDFRKTDNTVMREYPLTHSGGYNILMTLDYCVAKEDLRHLSLSISTSLASFRKGISWASCKIIVTVSHMDFPVKANMQETMGVLHLADSDLQEYISDPRSSDGVITPQAFQLLKASYKRGEIENINQPRDDKKEVNVARTTMGPVEEEVNVRDLMADLRAKGLERARQNAGMSPPRSSMKKPKAPLHDIKEGKEMDRGDFDSLSEVGVEDARSDVMSEETIDLPRNSSSPQANMRSVNFG